MAEPEVATKAPESDAQESQHDAPTPSNPSAPSNPPMGEHCTSDRPTPSGQASTGEITKLNDIDVS